MATKNNTMKDVKKSKPMKKSAVKKTDRSNNIMWDRNLNRLEEYTRSVIDLYDDYFDANPDWNERESELYNGIDNLFDELETMLEAYVAFLGSHIYKASTKKSRKQKQIKELDRLMKDIEIEVEDDDDEEESEEDDDDDEEVEIEVEDDDSIEESKKSKKSKKSSTKKVAPLVAGAIASAVGNVASGVVDNALSESDDIALSEEDMIRKPCKACGKKTRKAEMPDADDQQDDTEGSGKAKEELPEDADEQQEEKDGDSKSEEALPEEANEQQDEKQARFRKKARKFSVTANGSQQFDGRLRYVQNPMMRECIDRAFPQKAEADLAEELNKRLADINKSKRNASNTSVPMRVRTR